jgi:hypothetical protein
MAVEQFARNNAAEFFYHIHIAVDRLLEYFIDHFEIPGKVRTFEAAGQVDIHIEIGDKNNRSFIMAIYFDKFFHIFNPDTGKIYTNVR